MQRLYIKRNAVRTFTSKYLGVNWHEGYKKFRSAISVHGTRKILGYFDSELAAALAYNDAAKRYGKDTLNFIE